MKTASPRPHHTVYLETLEPRIAPASLTGIEYKAITLGSPQLIFAGEGLSTSDGAGSFILAIEKGQALIFTTDLNGNNRFDANEITGISAGDGFRMTSFVDINGDIVTNLRADGTLSDSDGNAANGRDGLVLLNSKIEGITMRSVAQSDLTGSDTVNSRIILSNYSINGNIYAGGGVGVANAGVIIDTSGLSAQVSKFSDGNIDRQTSDMIPNIGGIKTGSAASEQAFQFGFYTDATAAALDGKQVGDSTVGGTLKPFVPGIGQAGGDIIGLKVGDGAANFVSPISTDPAPSYNQKPFTIGFLIAGDGGIGARGGNIQDIALMGDTGGLSIVAGQGGDGIHGGNGGSIINLSDAGSVNGLVQIKAGDGGEGFLGNAGAAGSITLGTFKTNGQIYMGLGSGGNALVNAGSGTSLVSGLIEPSGDGGFAQAIDVLSTWRPDNAISDTAQIIDFNSDGIQDLLYVTSSPNQLAVKFGVPFGGVDWSSPTVYFNSPSFVTADINSTGITVADFNGDGLLDFAVASSTGNSSDGLRTFINDGTWYDRALAANTGGNYVESFVHSQLPFLPGAFAVEQYDLKRGPSTITDLISGDFNGDGITDLAYLTQGNVNGPIGTPITSLVVLEGTGNGHFFANFQYDRTTDARLGNPVYTIDKSGLSEFIIKSTVTTETDASTSRIVMAKVGDKKFDVVSYTPGPAALVVTEVLSGNYRASWWDHVDPDKIPELIKPALIQDFTILDIADGGVKDGYFDIVALNSGDALTTFQGDAAGGLTFTEGVAIVGKTTLLGENAGALFSITTGDFDSDPTTSEIAVLTQSSNGWFFQKIGIDGFDIYTQDGKTPATSPAALTAIPIVPGMDMVQAPSKGTYAPYDLMADFLGDLSFVSAGIFPDSPLPYNYIRTPSGGIFDVNDNSLTLRAGDGGDSYLGNGGDGGGFGSGGLNTSEEIPLSASFTVINPADVATQTSVKFRAANGGNGFLNGGKGGSISGLIAEFAEGTTLLAATTQLYGGFGGWGLTGSGGAGGNLSGFFANFGTWFQSGDGGNGSTGGNGGDILANSIAAGRSTYTTDVTAITGNGGNGIFTGGNGGRLNGFNPEIAATVAGGDAGGIQYFTGSGGNAIAGRAGNGGEINGSSPLSTNNNTAGMIEISTGEGGDGQTGGSGGNLINFSHLPTITSPALAISVLAGAGGTGTSGNGGNGGSVSGFTGSATGIAVTWASDYQFNRVIAGQGGDSFGATGGEGGSLASVTTTANSSASAIAAGRGGDGLIRGGKGGSITNSSADSAAGVGAKVIVIAGAGGNAFSALATAPGAGNVGDSTPILDLRTFGGANGTGGDGGSISNFKQPKTINAAVDLFAGNGGDTPNYGNPAMAKTGTGKGGSLSGITLAGEAGRVNSGVQIVSYEIGTGVDSISEFVQDTLRDSPSTQLTDAIGNVGVVAGQAGRVKGDLPGGDAATKTGSVTNFSARGIMSMVAGSVDRIAAINTISGLTITAPGGALGAYKNTPTPHSASNPLYYTLPNQTGDVSSVARIGGSLMDGAIVTLKNNTGLVGSRIFVQ